MSAPVEDSANADVRRLRAVLDAASDGYLCADASAVVVDCNRAAEELFGHSREELIGAVLPELMAPAELHEKYHAIYQQLLADGGSHEPLELSIASPDGMEMILAVSTWTTEVEATPVVHALYRDVTEQKRLQAKLAEHTRRLTDAQALARLGSWEWDVATGAVVWSAQLYHLFGIEEGTPVTYATFSERLHPDDRAWVEAEIDVAALNDTPLTYEARIVRTDGQVRWIAAHGNTTTDGHGVPVQVRGTVSDITDRKLVELEFERLAVTDALTGLANRTLLDRRLETALDGCRDAGASVSLLLIDLDGFKPVNDTHGHAAGDAVLIELSSRLSECIRPGDTLARVGGDEFALLLPGADRGDATRIAQRLVETASTPVTIDDTTTVSVGASVGIAVGGGFSTGLSELRRQADHAMYMAKRSGRGRHVLFTPELVPAGTQSLTVCPRDAHAWAEYVRELHAEIARRTDEGALTEASRTPASVGRTLEPLLAAIEHLPYQREDAQLPLPDHVHLDEFVFHQSMVHDWADALLLRGVLTTRRPPRATAFWTQLQDVTVNAR